MNWDDLVSKIDVPSTKMRPYTGFIFLCGGPIDPEATLPISVRDALLRELSKDEAIEPRLRIAENFKDWSLDAHYRDLVSFERHLAELSSVIVLVLESPGSIAELGLFSAIVEYQEKLVVVIESAHYLQESFIRLGPIDFLEKFRENSAECHRWFADEPGAKRFDPAAALEIQREIADSVVERASRPTPERRFDAKAWLDRALLTCDLLNLYSALTVRELCGICESLAIQISEPEVKQMLFLLQRVQLVAMEPKGDQRFFVSIDSRRFLRLRLTDASFDLDRFRVDQLSRYEREDKRRFRAIASARRRHAKR